MNATIIAQSRLSLILVLPSACSANHGTGSTSGTSISGASNACVQTGDEGAATEDLTIECNWLSGGGYTLSIRGTGETRPKNTRILYNRFTRDSAYDPWTIDDLNPTMLGNTYDDGTAIEEFKRLHTTTEWVVVRRNQQTSWTCRYGSWSHLGVSLH